MKKTVLVTGGTGFIGHHLLQYLKTLSQYEVIAFSSKEISGIKTILHQNYTFDKSIFEENGLSKIDVVIHAGAFAPKTSNEANNVKLSNSNIFNTQHLLNNLPSVNKFIFLSTLDVYKQTDIITEQSMTEPVSLYGWSKLYCEHMIENWGKEQNVSVQVLRIGHIYGSGEEKYQKLIPVTIRKCLANENPVIFSDGKEKRAFLHVSDCVKAIVKAIDLTENVGVINIVSEESLSVYEIVSIITNAVDKSLTIEIKNNVGNLRSLVFDASKMKQYLHTPEVFFRNGIEEEIEKFVL
jgi:nucleoside-diphosphate-sugar epimerase